MPASSSSGHAPIDLEVVEGQHQTVNKKTWFQGNCYNCGKYGHMAKDCHLPSKNPKVLLNAAVEDDKGSKNEWSLCRLYAMPLLNQFPMVLHRLRLLLWYCCSENWCDHIASSVMLIRDVGPSLITAITSIPIVLRYFNLNRLVWVWKWQARLLLLMMFSNMLMLTWL